MNGQRKVLPYRAAMCIKYAQWTIISYCIDNGQINAGKVINTFHQFSTCRCNPFVALLTAINTYARLSPWYSFIINYYFDLSIGLKYQLIEI